MRSSLPCPALLFPLFISVAVQASAGLPSKPPVAPAREVTDVYWGQEVVDAYQYLEQVDDPEVKEWVEGQSAYARAWLDSFPYRDALAERVKQLTHADSPDHYSLMQRGDHLFAIEKRPPKQQPFLVRLPTLDDVDASVVVVDPNRIDPDGRTSIDFYAPSHEGRYVAVSLSRDGTEEGTLHFYDVETGEALHDEIPRVNGGTAGGSVAWTADGDGVYYTRYPSPGERPVEDLSFYQEIWFHRMGSPISEDHYVLGRSFPRISEIALRSSDDGEYILARVSNGDGGEHEYWLWKPDNEWVRIAELDDWIVQASFGADDAVYLLSRKDAPKRKILRMRVDQPQLSDAQTIVEESGAVITSFAVTAKRIYVVEMLGGPSWVHTYDLEGNTISTVWEGDVASTSGLVRLGRDRILLRRQSYTAPPAWYEYGPKMEEPRPTALVTVSPADFTGCEVRRIFATAEDGTRIPINIIMERGTPLDGSAPLILSGYGSYGISMTPGFRAIRSIWIEQGGVHAIANIRGGGEYGDAWHRAANLEKKKTSMDDFAACARHLIQERYTSRDRLAIEGGSAGGLMVYGTMALYPDLMEAVVSHVGIGDALRTELSPNGEFNTTEFGTVKDEEQFWGMYAYSPFHRIRDGVEYPAVLALTGMNDPRVEPWQTFKMTARLQATGTSKPVLMRVSMKSGHGGGSSLSERDAKTVDVHAFLFMQLGVAYQPVPRMGKAQ